MFVNLARELKVRFPWLSGWFGEHLEVDLTAFLASLTMHGLLLVALAFVGYRVHQESSREFHSDVVDSAKLSSDSTFQDLDQTANPPATIPAAGSLPRRFCRRSRFRRVGWSRAESRGTRRRIGWNDDRARQTRCSTSERAGGSLGHDARADRFNSRKWCRARWWS